MQNSQALSNLEYSLLINAQQNNWCYFSGVGDSKAKVSKLSYHIFTKQQPVDLRYLISDFHKTYLKSICYSLSKTITLNTITSKFCHKVRSKYWNKKNQELAIFWEPPDIITVIRNLAKIASKPYSWGAKWLPSTVPSINNIFRCSSGAEPSPAVKNCGWSSK